MDGLMLRVRVERTDVRTDQEVGPVAAPAVWVEEVMDQCECCGIGLEVGRAECGHWFCYICRGRGHDVECDGRAGHERVLMREEPVGYWRLEES